MHGMIAAALAVMLTMTACTAQAPAPTSTANMPTDTVAAPPPAATLTATTAPSPTVTRTPTALPSPTPTLPPTITPTPLPWSGTALSADNAAQTEQLASWGRGPVERAERAGTGRVLALTTLGVYLYRESPPELVAAFPGATDFLASPLGNQVALVYPDGTLRLASLESGETEHVTEAIVTVSKYFCDTCDETQKKWALREQYASTSLGFSSDGSLLAASFGSGVIGVWDTTSGELRWRLFHESVATTHSLMFAPDKTSLYSTGRRRAVPVLARWSLEDGSLLWYQTAAGKVAPNLFSPDGSLLGTTFTPIGDRKPVLRLYRVKDGSLVGQIGGAVSTWPYAPDSSQLVITNTRNVQVYKVQPDFQVVRTLWTQLDWPLADFSLDGRSILLNGGQVIYSAVDYQQTGEGPAPTPAPEPPPIFSGRAWLELQHLPQASGIDALPGPGLSIHSGRQQAWLTRWDGEAVRGQVPVSATLAWRWDPLSGAVQSVEFSAKPSWDPAFSPDGQWAAACTENGVEVLKFGSDEKKNFGRCLSNGALAFSPDGATLLLSSGPSFKRLRLSDGGLVQDFVGSGYKIAWMKYSADGSRMFSAGLFCAPRCKGDQRLWKIDPPGGVRLEPDGSVWPTTDIVFAADQSFFISAKTYIWKWNAANGQLLGRLPGTGQVLALSPDDRLLAVGDSGGAILLVSVEERTEVARLQGPESRITALAFTLDGTGLVSAAEDGSITLWGVR